MGCSHGRHDRGRPVYLGWKCFVCAHFSQESKTPLADSLYIVKSKGNLMDRHWLISTLAPAWPRFLNLMLRRFMVRFLARSYLLPKAFMSFPAILSLISALSLGMSQTSLSRTRLSEIFKLAVVSHTPSIPLTLLPRPLTITARSFASLVSL